MCTWGGAPGEGAVVLHKGAQGKVLQLGQLLRTGHLPHYLLGHLRARCWISEAADGVITGTGAKQCVSAWAVIRRLHEGGDALLRMSWS